MKKCAACKETLPLAAFHRHWGNNLRRICGACYWAKYGAAKNANRQNDDARARRRLWNTHRQFSPAKRDRELRHSERRRMLYPEKQKATRAVRDALRTGSLTRPAQCQRCKALPTPRRDGRSGIQAHHSDYTKPLDVEWLCVICHAAGHRAHPSQPKEGEAQP